MSLVEIKQPSRRLKLKKVAKGLWEVEGAYSGTYDFFECSPIYCKDRHAQDLDTPAQASSSPRRTPDTER